MPSMYVPPVNPRSTTRPLTTPARLLLPPNTKQITTSVLPNPSPSPSPTPLIPALRLWRVILSTASNYLSSSSNPLSAFLFSTLLPASLAKSTSTSTANRQPRTLSPPPSRPLVPAPPSSPRASPPRTRQAFMALDLDSRLGWRRVMGFCVGRRRVWLGLVCVHSVSISSVPVCVTTLEGKERGEGGGGRASEASPCRPSRRLWSPCSPFHGQAGADSR
ncbi:hypothetical protein K505DRAFT_158911 [Melanomma pulvis-pyrius CBS 109.77]|uniref:Uncharacterized protein n=1 Tax=Melanomma pulvis-pyrius CBS 109.77 TaxID=1314802 RepID=A0A6A6WPK8_9PLEO|nr:hypothetical protein K505DRAFT_158911 [Melanomma pulvis-pyrius CBS 109.77]